MIAKIEWKERRNPGIGENFLPDARGSRKNVKLFLREP